MSKRNGAKHLADARAANQEGQIETPDSSNYTGAQGAGKRHLPENGQLSIEQVGETKSQRTARIPASLRDAALQLAREGFPVFYCHYILGNGACSCGKPNCKSGKHPANGKGGFLKATTDEGEIRRAWDVPYNIGLATGHAWPGANSDHKYLAVVDIDVAHGKKGRESLAALIEQYGPLPETRRVRTGSGGTHYYFLTRVAVKNVTADDASKNCPLGINIDVRGKGGYVIAPPSNHASGGHYEIENPDSSIAPMPEWMEGLLVGKPENTARTSAPGAGSTVYRDSDAQDAAVADNAYKTLTDEELQAALDAIPPEELNSYEPGSDRPGCWWEVGAALWNILGDGNGTFQRWLEFSRRATKYETNYSKDLNTWESGLRRMWSNFRPSKYGYGTIIHYAKLNKEYSIPNSIIQAVNAAVREQREAGWVYCIATQEFVSPDRAQRLTKSQFSDKFAPQAPKRGTFADACLANEDYPRVDALTFAPNGEMFETEGNQLKLNLWRPSPVTPSPGDVGPFIEHAEFILPKERERQLFLQYLAFQVRYPGVKVRWTVVLQGKQRTGKSYFGRMMAMVLGEHNVNRPTNERLHETWTDWQEGAQLIVVEELMGYGRQQLMNKLKPMITEPTTTVRLVGGHSYPMPNRYNFLMFTNHKGALKIDREDKRYCILFSPAERRADAYYDALWSWTDKNLPAIADYLATLPVDGFRPNGDAPETEARQQAIEMNRNEIATWIEDGIQNNEGPFACDLVVIDHLLLVVPEHVSKRERLTSNAIAEVLEQAGSRQVGRAQLQRFGYKRIWAVRRIDHWLKQSEGKRGEEYLNFLQITAGRAIADVDFTLEDVRRVGQVQKDMEGLIKDTRPM